MCRPAGRCIYYIWEDHHIIKSVAPCRPAGSCIILLVVYLQHYFCLFAYIILETTFSYSVLNFVGTLLRLKEIDIVLRNWIELIEKNSLHTRIFRQSSFTLREEQWYHFYVLLKSFCKFCENHIGYFTTLPPSRLTLS